MKLPPFEYACPTSISEAVALLASHDGEAKALAGGQSLVPMMAFRVASPSLLVDLRKLAELRQIKIADVGGSLAHADPAAEMPGIVVTCEAQIAVVGKAGARVIDAANFFQGPLMTALKQ